MIGMRCRKCGRQNPDQSIYCESCGVFLEAEKITIVSDLHKNKTEGNSKRNIPIVLLGISLLLIVCAGIFVVYQNTQLEHEKQEQIQQQELRKKEQEAKRKEQFANMLKEVETIVRQKQFPKADLNAKVKGFYLVLDGTKSPYTVYPNQQTLNGAPVGKPFEDAPQWADTIIIITGLNKVADGHYTKAGAENVKIPSFVMAVNLLIINWKSRNPIASLTFTGNKPPSSVQYRGAPPIEVVGEYKGPLFDWIKSRCVP